MKVAIGADHKGFELKERIKEFIKGEGKEVTDFGTDSEESCDYPDYGLKVAEAVARGEFDRGILVCWTGNGMNISANKVKGIRSALCLNPELAVLARQHNDANVLTIASKFTPVKQALEIVRAFLFSEFEGGRHQRRVNKIKEYERETSFKQGQL
jgi:ribose 5-phosphate isomerase B